MRAINWALAAILAAFAVLQVNDPDALVWVAVYGVAAIWSAIAAWRPWLLRRRLPARLLGATVVAVAVAVAWLWPEDRGWWRVSVWWNAEGAREELGLLIVLAALALAALSARRRRLR